MKRFNFFVYALVFAASPDINAAGDHSGHHQHAQSGHSSAHWMAPAAEAARKNAVEATQQSISKGRQLYFANCSACHGKEAMGDGPAGKQLKPSPANLKAMSGAHPDGDFAYKIREGRGAMPGWKQSLDETSIWHLVNFIQSLSNQVDGNPSKQMHGHGGHNH